MRRASVLVGNNNIASGNINISTKIINRSAVRSRTSSKTNIHGWIGAAKVGRYMGEIENKIEGRALDTRDDETENAEIGERRQRGCRGGGGM